MPVKITAETFNETIVDFKVSLYSLYPNPFAKGLWKKTRFGDMLHKAMNILTEAVRRNAQIAAKVILFGFPTIVVLYEWGNKIIPN